MPDGPWVMATPSSGPSRAQQVGQQTCPPVGSGASPPPPCPGHQGLCSSHPGSLVTAASPADPPSPPSHTLSPGPRAAASSSQSSRHPPGSTCRPLWAGQFEKEERTHSWRSQGPRKGREGPDTREGRKLPAGTGPTLPPPVSASCSAGPRGRLTQTRAQHASSQPHSCDPLLWVCKMRTPAL